MPLLIMAFITSPQFKIADGWLSRTRTKRPTSWAPRLCHSALGHSKAGSFVRQRCLYDRNCGMKRRRPSIFPCCVAQRSSSWSASCRITFSMLTLTLFHPTIPLITGTVDQRVTIEFLRGDTAVSRENQDYRGDESEKKS